MMCCRKTACQNCVDTVMCKSSLTSDGVIPEGKFQCSLCQSKVYATSGAEKHVPLTINDIVLEQIETCENFLPIYCD